MWGAGAKNQSGEARHQGKKQDRKNIRPETEIIPKWNPDNLPQSLDEIYKYALEEANKASDWYWRNKRWKAIPSRIIRFLAWILAAVGGLLPVLGYLLPHAGDSPKLSNGLWASLLLGLAAALFGLDKAFGYSTGWARYVLTASSIRKALEEFRMDWTELRAKAGNPLTAENVVPLLDRAKKFRIEIEALVLQETKEWVAEFQTNLAQMEKDIAAQLSKLKTQVEESSREAAGPLVPDGANKDGAVRPKQERRSQNGSKRNNGKVKTENTEHG